VAHKTLGNLLPVHPLFQDQEMPLLVVLLPPALLHPFENAPGEIGLLVDVRDCNIGDVFPRLIGYARDQLQDPEFAPASPAAIEQIDRLEEHRHQQAIPHHGRGGLGLLVAQVRSEPCHGVAPSNINICPVRRRTSCQWWKISSSSAGVMGSTVPGHSPPMTNDTVT
jgi:hypothetical protein